MKLLNDRLEVELGNFKGVVPVKWKYQGRK